MVTKISCVDSSRFLEMPLRMRMCVCVKAEVQGYFIRRVPLDASMMAGHEYVKTREVISFS